MTRSRKKPHATISTAWGKFKERMFRRKVKREIQKIKKEIPFDPDRDFEESLDYGKMGNWVTRLGFDIMPDPDDSIFDWANKMTRK